MALLIKIYLRFCKKQRKGYQTSLYLTHWGRVTHICVGKINIIASDNGLSPGRHQAIIWTNAKILLIEPLGTKLIEIHTFSFKKMHLKMSSAKRRPFCLGPNLLISHEIIRNITEGLICLRFKSDVIQRAIYKAQNTNRVITCVGALLISMHLLDVVWS